MYESDQAAVYGTTFTVNNVANTRLQMLYLQKYGNLKINDENYEETTQWELAGLNFSNTSIQNLRLSGQFHWMVSLM